MGRYFPRLRHSIACAAILFVTHSALAAAPAATPVATTLDTAIILPSFGIRATLPLGFVRAKEPSPNTAFQIVRVEKGKLLPEGGVQLDITGSAGAKDSPTLQTYAQSLAKATGTTVQDTKTKVGGKDAIELLDTNPANATKRRPVRLRVIEHAAHYYLLYQVAEGENPSHDGFDAVAASIVWSEPTRPVEGLRARKSLPFPLASSGLICDMPDPFRQAKIKTADEVLMNSFDFVKNKLEVAATITSGAAPGEVDPELFKIRFNEMIQKGGWSQPEWRSHPNRFATVLSTKPVQLLNPPAGAPQRRLQVFVAFTKDGHSATIAFDYPADVADRYNVAITELLPESIRPALTPASKPTSRPVSP